MEMQNQRNGVADDPKIRKYNNIILSVFIEKDMLCLADLYVVIGLPLSNFKSIEKKEDNYRFFYWHKKKGISNYKDKGLHQLSFPVRSYQADYYYALCFEDEKKEYAVYVPFYEIEAYQEVLNRKENEES